MRSYIMIALSVCVFGVLNYGIYEKQLIKDHGEIVLLELAPVDPRSLMQGDYMRLRYAIARAVPREQWKTLPKRGYMVIQPDENNVAQFIRLHNGEQLKDQEKLLHFHNKRGVHIVPNSFLFQEGHAEYYEDAKYGVFKFDSNGKHLLVGLADENKKEIIVSSETF
ncbi:MAG: hypothetical protein COA45_12160 [Zetaproteobacteria bacterium]|nr:MAG: hypothetical protein COA45_12160 [Zetaproteobacteria bacterium]